VTALAVRPATRADAPAVAALLARVGGPLVEPEEEIAGDLGRLPSTDAALLEEGDEAVGLVAFLPRGALIADARLTALHGREGPLLEALERRSAELRLPIVRINARPVDLDLGAFGYARVRTFRRLVADRATVAEQGPGLAEVCRADDEAVYALEQTCFTGHWGFLPESYGGWRDRVVRHDPSPAFLVRTDGEPVGAARAMRRYGRAWIGSLVVAPEARGRRLGEMLVRAAATAFDTQELGLEVDTENAAAGRLYDRLGFVEIDRREFWEKELAA
jgi:ribosomal protein S18 acetylase RimI-like enzyme